MKVIGYTALHYGSDYLGWAIRSIIDHIDEYHVLYAARGSHGSRTFQPCPDTREDLYAIASRAAGNKLRWWDGDWTQEGQQRDSIFGYAPDADVILTLDADEIWPEALVYCAIDQWSEAKLIQCRSWRMPIIHYWRSFYRAILHDPAYPERVIYPHVGNAWDREHGVCYINPPPTGREFINHMGYAQRSEIVDYKQLTHGHKGEWRRDINWFQDRFMANAQQDCHPVGSEYWNPEQVKPLDYMPAFMVEHPYYKLDVIP